MVHAYLSALAVLHRTFGHESLVRRGHILGRFLTCPFLRVVEALPPAARVLDIGAGHGTFARLAVAHGARSVLAVEPDLRKTLRAYRHPQVRFVAGFDPAVGGTFDAVTMIDVLYKVPLPEWDALFARILTRLRPGGVLLLKELDPEHPIKAGWNRAQERFATAIRLTLGEAFSYETRAQLGARLGHLGYVRFEARDIGAFYPHAHVLLAAFRPE